MKTVKNIKLYLITIIALSLSVQQIAAQQNDVQKNQLKFSRLLRLVDGYYVDSTNVNKLTEKAIVGLLDQLDPHSSYISKEEVDKMNEPLKGNFEGIGISFNIFKDTLLVTTTISGGPSEKVGLRAGDRIIEVDGKEIAGIGLKNSDVFNLLRGKKGTEVTLKVARRAIQEPITFKIIRDKIPIFSLDASYMLNKETGYIKLNKFSATTEKEFISAINELKTQGLENLILDLRGNGGGYLRAAVGISDQFLSDNMLVVFTEGTNEPKREYKASAKGTFEKGKLVVLVNEGSASASEIVSGAVQDWDRGIIIGRRSFGKGLVQRQFMLTDGSMVRLTTSHYHTPSGRCIQKPYSGGKKDYRKDYAKRMTNGEMFSADSIEFDEKLKHKTLINNRSVYGGGGIMPDIFIPLDTSSHYKYLNSLRRKRVIYDYTLDYIDTNRKNIKTTYPSFDTFNAEFELSDTEIKKIVEKGVKAGIEKNEESLSHTKENLKREVKALVARDIYSRNDMYKVFNNNDDEIERALELIKSKTEYNKLLISAQPKH